MNDLERLDDELARSINGHPWHGPSLAAVLNGVTAPQARARPIGNAHTIWELVLHLTAWANEVERRLREDVRPLPPEADWPAMTGTDSAAWAEATRALFASHERLRDALRQVPPSELDTPLNVTDESDGTFFVMLHGVSQHIAYHAGQIILLAKSTA